MSQLDFIWSQGYNGSRIAFIQNDVMCYVCGHNVKFIHRSTGESGTSLVSSYDHEQAFVFPGEGMGVFAVHSLYPTFAIAERCLNPRVFVYDYPDLQEICKLTGGAKLCYSQVEFSYSIYMATLSTLPDFLFSVWNYQTGELLCQSAIDHITPTSLSFNPGNWRQVCITTESTLSLWTMEQSNNVYIMKQRKLVLPSVDQSALAVEIDFSTRNSSRMSHFTMDLPKAAIAGLVGDIVNDLPNIQDTTVRVSPVSHTWTPKGDIIVGCKSSHLLQIDGDMWTVNMKYNPLPDLDLQDDSVDLVEGSLNCLIFHKNGVYAIGSDGVLRLINISNHQISVAETCNVGVPVCHFSVSTDYTTFVLGSPNGSIHTYEPGSPNSLSEYINLHYGSFVSIARFFKGNEYIVTLRGDGELQLWHMETSTLALSIPIGIQSTCLACSPVIPLVAVGTASGHVYFIDLTDLSNSRILERIHLYHEPITHLTYQLYGDFIIAAAEDSAHIFILDGSVKTTFKVLGYTDIDGIVGSVSMATDTEMNTSVAVTHRSRKTSTMSISLQKDSSNISSNYAKSLTHFDITQNLLSNLENQEDRSMFNSLRNDFTDEALNKLTYTFREPVFGAAIGKGNSVFAIQASSRKIAEYRIPDKKPHKRDTEGWILNPLDKVDGHLLSGGHVTISPNGHWMISHGTDGSILIHETEHLYKIGSFTPHDFKNGGVVQSCFDHECQMIFSVGHDDIVTCYKWSSNSCDGRGLDRLALEFSRSYNTKLNTKRSSQEEMLTQQSDWVPPPVSPREVSTTSMVADGEEDEMYVTPPPILASDSTWRDQVEREARKVEDKEFVESKKDLRHKIRDVRRTIQQMMRENNQVADIEKLGHHEFDLDMEEQARLQAEGDQEVNRIRDEIEFDNLAKMYLKEAIKKECWDDMLVKGRSLQAFSAKLDVSNYPLRPVSTQKQETLERASKRRQLEVEELKSRRELLESSLKTSVDDIEGNEDDDRATDQTSLAGSLANEYGGSNCLFHSQFDLHSRLQKSDQILLLVDSIYRMKQRFNKMFDEVYKKKESEIKKIREKNKRISKILKDLSLPDPVIQPELSNLERPENVLVVLESEITVEKFLTADQKKQLQAEKDSEEERLRQERGDNWRERGLDKMMGGLLEIKKEDELKKDVPLPVFMREGKDPGQWNEEEIKAAKEYERKCVELEEEREKYRKQLETELRKLQALIQDGMSAFDDSLHQLFILKTKTQMVVNQEELKIVRLRYSLLKEEELETRELSLNYLQETKLHEKNESARCLMEARQQVDAFREQYDILVAEDKILDKQFRREFSDCAQLLVEMLYKQFRKRPKGQKYRPSESHAMLTQNNPFHHRPSTATKEENTKLQQEAFLKDADDPVNAPEGVTEDLWQKFCGLRRQKMDSELNVKVKTNVMADMMSFLSARQDEDEALKEELDNIVNEISRLKDKKMRFLYDLDVQLVLKQGQVEVDQGTFAPSYLDSVLVHRSVIEDLNVKIKQLGESKISSMLTSKKSRKGIVKLEWEYKRIQMSIEDLQNKMKDITFMKVTREIQAYLQNKEEYDALKLQEITTFEETINVKRQQHEEQLKEKRQMMQTLTRSSKGKANDNVGLDGQLRELNVTLNERKHIDDINSDARIEKASDKKYIKIVQRRRLVDLAKAQAQEVAVLRAEVERLRMRTFPALVQVER